MSESFSLKIPDSMIETIVERVLERLSCPDEDDGYVTARGASEFLGISIGAVRKLEQRGEIRGYRPNGTLFFKRAELRRWVSGG